MKNQWGDTIPKGVGVAHRPFRLLMRHCLETTHAKMRYAADNEAKKPDHPPSLNGAKKEMSDKGAYNRFSVSPFHRCILCTVVPYLFDHFNIMR